jgi:homocitrate synthase
MQAEDPPSDSRFKQYAPRPFEVIDTTLREGQQTSLLHDHYKYFFTPTDKEEILRALIIFGVKFVELFAPVVSQRERDDFARLQAVRNSLITQTGYTFLLAHVRCHPRDIESAILAGADGLNMYVGTSLESREYNHGLDLKSIISQARSLIDDVRRSYPDLILRFSGEDAFRTREEDLFAVYDEIAPLVDRLGLPDTVGTATPASIARRVKALLQRYPGIELEAHFHDDRGLATINALEAVRCGVRYVDSTVLGIGERSGITSLTALIFNLFLEHQYDYLEGYRLRGSYPLNVLVADKMKKLVPSKEPVSLTNRTHSAGVHQNAILHHASAYEAHPLDQFGVSESEILLGPLSGWNAVHYFLKEIRYYQIDEATAREITRVFKERIYDLVPENLPEQVLVQIAEKEFGLARLELPEAARGQIIQRLDSREADAEGQRASGITLTANHREER